VALRVRPFILCLLLLAIALLQPLPAAGQGDFPDVCQQGQLLQNCDFSQGLNGWQSFIEGGAVSFSTIDGGGCHSPLCPAAFMVADGSFVGGLYQQVPATPGVTYWANATWLVFEPAGKLDNTVGRRVGIDPTGGTDSTSPSVVWSQDLWRSFEGCAYKICPELQVSAVAQNSTITVFLRIEDTWKDRRDEFGFVPDVFFNMEEQFWLDDMGLVAIGGEPAALPPTDTPVPVPPTDTPAPPTDTPVPIPPTDTPAPPTDTPVPPADTPVPISPIDTPTPAAELVALAQAGTPTTTLALPTDTPVPTATPTAAPSATPTPPPPTATARPSPTATATPVPALGGLLGLVGGGMFCLGGAGAGVFLVLGGFLFWLYRLGTSDELEDDEFEEFGEEDSGQP
jgi:hypothetical protein